ncbi:peptidase S41 [Kordiimonas sediminis]|uniref:Peptidase S41 n=1 Tax=Kordiimonas sediminis TaxID=1735581 RepID=A0A919AS94_9PROT|nr:S41 family peptidase [Kordiimonas sediminis]GHF20407.1 peptidase S41 [Kordiimonas sediminis]
MMTFWTGKSKARALISGSLLAMMMALPTTAPVSAAPDDQENVYEQLDLLMRVFQRVRNEYVDDVNDKEVIEAAIQGMLRSLDPHSSYLNEDVFKQVRVQVEGEYGGLGLEVQMEKGVVKVVSPIDDTPAAKAGIQGGDLITHIDGKEVMGGTLTDAVEKMRGPVGSELTIRVYREGEDGPFDVSIVRDKIKVRSVRHRIEDDTIGYIRVTTFNMQAGEGVEKAIEAILEEKGDTLDGVILDLRNNPGGLLDQAIRISDAFIDHGEIVSTRGRRQVNNNRWYATKGDMLDGLPIVVLTNAYSASASEIVAGALQDHRRAVVIGDRTFGKGTVQSEIRLGREGNQAIRLTTARYFTPSGHSIQERGIEPDIEVLFPRPAGARGTPRREIDLRGHIENDQNSIDRTGEEDDIIAEEHTPEPAAAADTAEDAAVEEAVEVQEPKEFVDVQLKYAIKLLKDMSKLPETRVAQASGTGQ